MLYGVVISYVTNRTLQKLWCTNTESSLRYVSELYTMQQMLLLFTTVSVSQWWWSVQYMLESWCTQCRWVCSRSFNWRSNMDRNPGWHECQWFHSTYPSPVPLSSNGKFENQNPDISVNVLYHNGNQIVPILTSTFADDRKHHATLLMTTDGNEKFHYLSVQSMSRLVSTGAKYKRKHYVCTLCLKKNDNDVLRYNFNAHQPILIIFGRDIAEWICY